MGTVHEIHEDAAAYLKKFGFVKGQHFKDETGAFGLAWQVARELRRKALCGDDGFMRVPEGIDSGRCKESCRGWDGKSDACDCGINIMSWGTADFFGELAPLARMACEECDDRPVKGRCKCGADVCDHCLTYGRHNKCEG